MSKMVEDQIREGIVTRDYNGTLYRTVFIEGNFHVYRFVQKGLEYRGQHYDVDGYVLSWSDMINNSTIVPMPPSFVLLRGDR